MKPKFYSAIFICLILFNCDQAKKEREQAILFASVIIATSTSNVSLNTEEAEFQKLVNNHRVTNVNCPALEVFAGLQSISVAHSQDMKNRNFFSHTNPDGKSPFDRIEDRGISYNAAGENIAQGYTSASSVLQGWLNSPGHKSNIENCNYTHHGIGYVKDGNYWTHLFAKNPKMN